MENTTPFPLIHFCKEYLSSGLYSDYTIICKDEDTGDQKEFHVHKVVIHACSTVLRNNLVGGFKEAQENTGVHNVYDPIIAFEALIYQMYNNKYLDSLAGAGSTMTFAVKAYAVADKYKVHAMRQLAASKLKNSLDPNRNLTDFITAIREIDASTHPNDSTLWDIVCPVVQKNVEMLLEHCEFKELILDLETLNFKLVRMVGESKRDPENELPSRPFLHGYGHGGRTLG